MALHQKCSRADRCPYASNTVPGTCGYHRCMVESGVPLSASKKYREYERMIWDSAWDDDAEY